MTTIMTDTEPQTQAGTSDDEVAHIVGWWQGLLDDLRLKVPTALCGVRLEGEGSLPDGTPLCPRCAELDGRHPNDVAGLVQVPEHTVLSERRKHRG